MSNNGNPSGQRMEISNSTFQQCTNHFLQKISTGQEPPDHIRFQVPVVPKIYKEREDEASIMSTINRALVPDETSNLPARVLLTGNRGYGKSWFMAKYIAVHHDLYDQNFIWFSNNSSIETNVRQLAVELRMPSSELRNFDHILADVLQYLKDRKALVVLQRLPNDNFLSKLKKILYQCLKISILAIEDGSTDKYPQEITESELYCFDKAWNRIILGHFDPDLQTEFYMDRITSLYED